MKKYLYVVLSLSAVIVLTGCNSQDNDKVSERARVEGQAQAEEQTKEEREAIDNRSKEMELSFAKKMEFYEDNAGHFDGTMAKDSLKFGIRISLFPNLTKPADNRVRTPAEIEADLTALSYNVQIVQWSLENPAASEGCRVEGLKPDMKTGRLNIISSECPNSYYLVLNRTTISGTAQPSTSRDPFQIYVERKSKTSTPTSR